MSLDKVSHAPHCSERDYGAWNNANQCKWTFTTSRKPSGLIMIYTWYIRTLRSLGIYDPFRESAVSLVVGKNTLSFTPFFTTIFTTSLVNRGHLCSAGMWSIQGFRVPETWSIDSYQNRVAYECILWRRAYTVHIRQVHTSDGWAAHERLINSGIGYAVLGRPYGTSRCIRLGGAGAWWRLCDSSPAARDNFNVAYQTIVYGRTCAPQITFGRI